MQSMQVAAAVVAAAAARAAIIIVAARYDTVAHLAAEGTPEHKYKEHQNS